MDAHGIKALRDAIKQAGGSVAVSRRMSGGEPYFYPQQIDAWLTSGNVPASAVEPLVAALNGAVSKSDLRPDVFGEAAP